MIICRRYWHGLTSASNKRPIINLSRITATLRERLSIVTDHQKIIFLSEQKKHPGKFTGMFYI